MNQHTPNQRSVSSENQLIADGGRTPEERRARREEFREALYEYGEVRCQACEEDGDLELATVDLSDADDERQAFELWNDHVREVHVEP